MAEEKSIVSAESLEILKATIPVVAPKVDDIVKVFYPKMLGAHPELYAFFNKTNQRTGRQRNALVESILAYATNITKLENLTPAVERIAHKHCALNVQAEHYQIVHDNLMAAIAEVLGDVVTPAIAAAWSEAVMALGGVLIKREKELYAQVSEAAGGWLGEREFVVAERVQRAERICSLKLRSADHKPVVRPAPGQHISVVANPTEDPVLAPRHYTVTAYSAEEGWYEITPKREQQDGEHAGVLSSFLNDREAGDRIKLFPPFGPALFEPDTPQKLAVFVSSGVGITPMRTLIPLALQHEVPVAHFHADHDAASHAFREELSAKLPESALVRHYYAHPASGDSALPHFAPGRLSGTAILAELDTTNQVHFYLCCNAQLVLSLSEELQAAGVPAASVHALNFGPHVKI